MKRAVQPVNEAAALYCRVTGGYVWLALPRVPVAPRIIRS